VHLSVPAVDIVAVVVDGYEVVVGPNLLELAESLLEQRALPETNVVDSRGICLDVGTR